MEQTASKIAIWGIGTAVPAFRVVQAEASARLAQALEQHAELDSARWAQKIFKQSGVETRYTCEPELVKSTASNRYLPGTPPAQAPTTAERMETYKRESVPLGLEAAKKAMADACTSAAEITHFITVSCTGQFLPGLDAVIARELGLSADVNRIPLHFLGCAAGLKAICLAQQLIAGAPSAVVLIVTVELCTLHIQPSPDRQTLFASSFFGDGASACIVGRSGEEGRCIYELGNQHSVLLPDTHEDMVWEVGNHGFELYLSPRIPKLLGRAVPAEVERLLQNEGKPELWAIHPGGRGIIDTLQSMFELTDEQTGFSRSILRRYGNMSSATILFVLDEIRHTLNGKEAGPASGIALAFGPGLTAEMLQVTYLPSKIQRPQSVNRIYV